MVSKVPCFSNVLLEVVWTYKHRAKLHHIHLLRLLYREEDNSIYNKQPHINYLTGPLGDKLWCSQAMNSCVWRPLKCNLLDIDTTTTWARLPRQPAWQLIKITHQVLTNEQGNYIATYNVISRSIRRSVRVQASTCVPLPGAEGPWGGAAPILPAVP